MARRLKAIATYINATHGDALVAEIVTGFCNTDRKIAGTRLRRPGKGRYGNRLIVKDKAGKVLIDHNAAETYRSNYEVESWLLHWEDEQ